MRINAVIVNSIPKLCRHVQKFNMVGHWLRKALLKKITVDSPEFHTCTGMSSRIQCSHHDAQAAFDRRKGEMHKAEFQEKLKLSTQKRAINLGIISTSTHP